MNSVGGEGKKENKKVERERHTTRETGEKNTG